MGTELVSTKEREKIVLSTCLKKMNPVLREHGFSEVSRTMPVCVGLWRNLSPAWRRAPVWALGSFPASQIFIPSFLYCFFSRRPK